MLVSGPTTNASTTTDQSLGNCWTHHEMKSLEEACFMKPVDRRCVVAVVVGAGNILGLSVVC